MTSNGTWLDLSPNITQAPPVRTFPAMEYDPQLGGLLLFGGYNPASNPYADTWEFVNANWTLLSGVGTPPAGRWGATLLWDPDGPYMILFGGRDLLSFYNDTWIFNTTGWHLLSTPVAPSSRGFYEAFYDPDLQKTVLFGGMYYTPSGSWVAYNDTWYLAGSTWSNVSGTFSASPPPIDGAYVAWDAATDSAIMAGGSSVPASCTNFDATWVFANGWTSPNLSPNPGFITGGAAAYDPSSRLLIATGGLIDSPSFGCDSLPQTWSYSAGAWTNITNATAGPRGPPPGRCCEGLAYDPDLRGVVMFAGSVNNGGGGTYVSETWLLTTSPPLGTFSASPSSGPAPLNVTFTSQVANESRTYSFTWDFGDGTPVSASRNVSHTFIAPGRYDVVWKIVDAFGIWSSSNIPIFAQGPGGWFDLSANLSTAPPPRAHSSMAFDPQWNGIVLFGGYEPYTGVPTSDTWLFSGRIWTDLTVAANLTTSPPARWGDSLVWDPLGPYLVLFGGRSSQIFNDTWVFDLTGWHSVPTGVAPSPRAFYQSFFDPTLSGIVLFGGQCASCNGGYSLDFNDTWEFSGGTWANISGRFTTAPPPTDYAFAAWDAPDGYAVMFGGQSGAGPCATYDSTWEFSTRWSLDPTTVHPPGLVAGGFAYDNSLGEAVLFSGYAVGCYAALETWAFSNGVWSDLAGVYQSPSTPYSRCCGTMAYDPVSKLVLLFGGNGPTYLNDTWTFPAMPLVAGPVAASVTVGTSPLSVNFTSSLSGGMAPYSYLWNFGDGSPAVAGQNAYHQFTVPGSRSVQWTGSDGAGRSVNQTLSLLVLPPLSAAVAGSPVAGLAPLDVVLTAHGAGGVAPYSVLWDFGDGSAGSSASVTPHTYTSVGTYMATARVTDSAGTPSTGSVAIQVVAPLSVTALRAPPEGYTPLDVSFGTDTSGGLAPLSFQWSFGDGNTSTQSAPSHEYGDPGRFTAVLTVSDSLGEIVSGNVAVRVEVPLRVSVSAFRSPVTSGAYVSFTAGIAGGFSPFTIAWFGLPASCASQNLTIVSCTVQTAGTYDVQASVSGTFGPAVTGEFLLTVLSAPNGGTVPPPSAGSAGVYYVAVGAVVLAAVAAAVWWWRRRAPPTRA